MGLTVLFQLTFTFIYNIFSKKFSISTKLANLKQAPSLVYLTKTKSIIWILPDFHF